MNSQPPVQLQELLARHSAPITPQSDSRKGPTLRTSAEKLAWLRQGKVGRLSLIPVPDHWAVFTVGTPRPQQRAMLHLDYTASAQGLSAMENYLGQCLETYANTHTETSATGRYSTQRFHQAIESIREHVNAGPESFVVPAGYGATGAIEKLQKILGLYLSPKGQLRVKELLGIDLKEQMAQQVVVFVGPYEHHSNDVSWQDSALCTFVRIKALREGPSINDIDCVDLEHQLQAYPNALKIASFSAASNVTGFRSDLKKLSTLLHQYNCLFFVDYAACSPYADIDMMRDGIDAIYLSVHKNLGGSNLGFLIGRRAIYDANAHPSFGGGGTVSAVTPWEYFFHASIEERESAGTPAIRQTWQAALSFQIKDWLGKDVIHKRESELCRTMMNFFEKHPRLQVLGNTDPTKRYPIFSFLVNHGARKLHHTFVAVLLNDFFGIQARSGCACAGPFGHELLRIEREQSDKYVDLILQILNGFKPGWTRIGFHYTLSDEEILYTQKALSAIAWFAPLFLNAYSFDPYTGDWSHAQSEGSPVGFSWEEALSLCEGGSLLNRLKDEGELYKSFQNQLEEFYALTSLHLARLAVQQASQRNTLAAGTEDKLATAFYSLVRQHIEQLQMDETALLENLSLVACQHLVPKGKDPVECLTQVRQMVRSILLTPETLEGGYETFKDIDASIAFFYVKTGRLARPIQLAIKPQGCTPCAAGA